MSATAIHEATHAQVAMDLGLTVRRLQVRGWVRVPRYCAQLYPGLVRGVPVRSPICLLEEDCLDTDPFAVLVAMAAPSFLATDDEKVNAYAGLEAMLAYRWASKNGIRQDRVRTRAYQYASICEPDIYALASRLEQEGRIDGHQLPMSELSG